MMLDDHDGSDTGIGLRSRTLHQYDNRNKYTIVSSLGHNGDRLNNEPSYLLSGAIGTPPVTTAGFKDEEQDQKTITRVARAIETTTRITKSRTTLEKSISEEDKVEEENKKSKERRSAAYFIAVNPTTDMRFMALWSQLECFTPPEKIQTIVIVAPDWSRKEGYLENFMQTARDRIPHLKDVKLVIKYYVNDRYDVGLWCDAAQDKLDVENDDASSIFDLHDDFILTNDSIMATKANYSDILDTLRGENLNMTSLNYSFLSDKNEHSLFSHRWIFSRSDKMWLESAFRGFNHDGMKTFLNNVCVSPDHPYFCPSLRNRGQRKRCLVESMEIRIGGLYPEEKVKGLFPADAPPAATTITATSSRKYRYHSRNNKEEEEGKMWHSNYKFWEFLFETKNFPVIKVSSNVLMDGAKMRKKEIFPTCTKFLEDSFLDPIRRRRIEHPRSKH